MACTPEKNQAERGQQECFASSSDPVLSGSNVAAQEEKGCQHKQQTVAHHPYESGPCIQHGMPDSSRLERSLGAALKQPGLGSQHGDTRSQRNDHEPSRPSQNSLLPSEHE